MAVALRKGKHCVKIIVKQGAGGAVFNLIPRFEKLGSGQLMCTSLKYVTAIVKE